MRIDRPRGPGEDQNDKLDRIDTPKETGRPDQPNETDDPWRPRTDAEIEADREAAFAAVREHQAKNPRTLFGRDSTGGDHPDDQYFNRPPAEKPDGEAVPESDRGWKTITEEIGEQKSWHSFSAAKRELGTVAGTEIHHIVERSQGKPERSGFEVERINSSDNMTRLPRDVHGNISAVYSSRPPGFDVTVRDWLNDKPWDFQHSYGCRVVDNEVRRNHDSDD